MSGVSDRIRVFIGTEPKTEIARKVLQCSIDRRTDTPVEYTPMIGGDWEYSTTGFKQGTGFSLRRWMIPNACDWHGRAIYLDADQIVFGDIRELWEFPLDYRRANCSAWMTYQPDKFNKQPWPQSSVMVIDCAAAKNQWGWELEKAQEFLRNNSTKKAYADFMHATWMPVQPVQIDTAWNHLNVYDANKTKLLHYTKEDEQPWYNPSHPFAKIWHKELQIAISRKYVKRQEFELALAQWGHQADHRKMNGLHPFYREFLSLF